MIINYTKEEGGMWYRARVKMGDRDLVRIWIPMEQGIFSGDKLLVLERKGECQVISDRIHSFNFPSGVYDTTLRAWRKK